MTDLNVCCDFITGLIDTGESSPFRLRSRECLNRD